MTERCHLGTSTRHYLCSVHHRRTVHGLRSGRNGLRRPVRFGCTVDQRRRQAGRTGRQLHRRSSEGAHGSQIGAHAGLCSRSACPRPDRPADHAGACPGDCRAGARTGTGTGASASTSTKAGGCACPGTNGARTGTGTRTDHCSAEGEVHRAAAVSDVDSSTADDHSATCPSAPRRRSATHHRRRRLKAAGFLTRTCLSWGFSVSMRILT